MCRPQDVKDFGASVNINFHRNVIVDNNNGIVAIFWLFFVFSKFELVPGWQPWKDMSNKYLTMSEK
jgi:hypothetical protein